jgi:parallel beta-helix repeat protein
MTPFPSRLTALLLSALTLGGSLLMPQALRATTVTAEPIQASPPAQWLPSDPVGETGQARPAPQANYDGQQVIHVDANAGSDGNPGTFGAPVRTIAAALSRARYGVTIKLAPGTYSPDRGEQFPIIVPAGVKLSGSSGAMGSGIEIIGGGRYLSRSFAGQEVAVVLEDGAIAEGLTISNPNVRGTGIWIENGSPKIMNCTLVGSHRDGIFVTGSATPVVESNIFQRNGGNGLSIARTARPIVRSNHFEATGFGITVGDNAQPLLQNNRIVGNTDGVIVTRSAQPIFRSNEITQNQRDGVVAIGQAAPDLGTYGNPGNNRIMGNGRYAIYNATQGNIIPAVGNQIDGGSSGAVTLATLDPVAPVRLAVGLER